ncbi:hypothetical protein HZR84_08310 [Hyphobacterium sp. CCMP332]|nr:hypothetical protein HZR84_08310 [Hyphobacterium sp. CCMP332]
MKLKVKTIVKQPILKVWEGFDETLFVKLAPPFPSVKLLQFDGSKKGDRVALELNFLLFRQKWISDIIEHNENEDQIFFIDKGVILPFFLKTWQHKHILKRNGNGTEIIDDIRYSTGTLLTDMLMFPGLYLQFLYRKPVYRKIFFK